MQEIQRKNKIILTAWIFLITVLSFIAIILASSALYGDWSMKIFGIEHQKIWDPGGQYLGAGITLFEQRHASFVGHPGLPLMYLINVLAHFLFWVGYIFGAKVSFDMFIANN